MESSRTPFDDQRLEHFLLRYIRRVLAAMIVTMASGAWGDTIHLKDGTVIQGVIRGETEEKVIIEYEPDKTKAISASEVETIKREPFSFASSSPRKGEKKSQEPPQSGTKTAPASKPQNPQQNGRPPRSVEEARARNSLKVGPGDSSDAIIAAYGKPSSDEVPKEYSPQVMRFIRYKSLGLSFGLRSDRIYSINVDKSYVGKIFGFRVNDSIADAIEVFGKDFAENRSEGGHSLLPRSAEAKGFRVYVWEKSLPDWAFFAKDDRITRFLLLDVKIRGPVIEIPR